MPQSGSELLPVQLAERSPVAELSACERGATIGFEVGRKRAQLSVNIGRLSTSTHKQLRLGAVLRASRALSEALWAWSAWLPSLSPLCVAVGGHPTIFSEQANDLPLIRGRCAFSGQIVVLG